MIQSGPARPLVGVRVVEFAHVAAGPFAGLLLADLGADVVKVEPPTGDQMRAWPPLRDTGGGTFSYNFASVNRNKRSVVADLKDPQDCSMVRALVAEADVLVENYRPGALARLGFGFEEVMRGHKGIVYCSITGFGRGGPYSQLAAFDVVVQGMSGVMSVTGDPDGEPAKCGVPIGDFVTGLYGALTVAAMLPSVRGTGRSVLLDCPMLDSLVAIAALQTSEFDGTGRPPARLGSAHPRNAPYRAFRAADKSFTIAAGNDSLWRSVCEVIGNAELADDPRFRSQVARVENQDALSAELEELFGAEPAACWIARLRARGIPSGPILSYDEVLADPHCRASGFVEEVEVSGVGPVVSVGYPVRTDGLAPRRDLDPPLLGQHNDEVVRDWLRR